jgi:hypothetical protein
MQLSVAIVCYVSCHCEERSDAAIQIFYKLLLDCFPLALLGVAMTILNVIFAIKEFVK